MAAGIEARNVAISEVVALNGLSTIGWVNVMGVTALVVRFGV